MTTTTSYLKYIPSMASLPSSPPLYLSTQWWLLIAFPGAWPFFFQDSRWSSLYSTLALILWPWFCPPELHKARCPLKIFHAWKCLSLIKIIITGTVNVEFTVTGCSSERVTCLILLTPHGPTREGRLLPTFYRWGVCVLEIKNFVWGCSVSK